MPAPLLVSNLINIRYLSGVALTDGLLLVRGRKRPMLLFVDNRYTEKAADEAKRSIRVIHGNELPRYLKRYKRVRFEANDVTVARLKRWKKQFRGTNFLPSEGVIEGWRRAKTKEEVRATLKACRITDRVLSALPRKIRMGMSEKDLGWEIEKLSRSFGADAMAFETIVAFGSSSSRPHHRPTNRTLRRGNLIQIDMGVKVDGYCSDCSRIFFTAKMTTEQKNVFDVLLQIVQETTTMAKTGASNRALDRYARKKLKKFGWDKFFLHSLGHGVGLEIHEGLNLSARAEPKKLLQNEVITTEPGIYFEGKWGMRIEDTILVGKRGGIRLTHAQYSH